MNVEDKACTNGGIQKSKHFFPTRFHGLVIYKCNHWSYTRTRSFINIFQKGKLEVKREMIRGIKQNENVFF
ncbi:MAG: hypothetical protein BGO52_19625 [Sphingobacteriales bacterium 44-61]|nr:MAG: hypothetical protein BGO52_19625 [Sphingobacteriales bacterium 44-61]